MESFYRKGSRAICSEATLEIKWQKTQDILVGSEEQGEGDES